MQLANNARTILASGINNSTQTIPLSDASLFPTVTATVLTGTVTSTGGNAYSVTGSGTLFTSELAVGDVVTYTGIEWRRVVQIVSNTVMILDREASVSGVTMTKRDAYYISAVNASGATVERMLVLATSGNTFTCARGQDGSSAAAFDAGASVEYRVTAGFIRQVIADAVVGALKNLSETHGADLIGLSATGVTATVVSDALEEIAAAVGAHIADGTAAHAATAISFAPTVDIEATTAQAAIEEVRADGVTLLAVHTTDPSAAHGASAISVSPAGGISSTDVQAALEELDATITLNLDNLEKIQDTIENIGVTYSAADDFQLSRGVANYAAGSDYWGCAGSAGSFTLSAPGGDNDLRKATGYFDGLRVRFVANNANTGAATLDVNTWGSKDVLLLLPDGTTTYATWRKNETVTLTFSGDDFYKDSPEDGAVLYDEVVTAVGAGTWNRPTGYSLDDTVIFRGVAGGGGGGVALNGTVTVYAAGGEGGTSAVFCCRFEDCPASVDYDVGAGGVGHNLGANGATAGDAGADTTMDFGSFTITANGGAGGAAATAATATTPNAGWGFAGKTIQSIEFTGGVAGEGDTVPVDGGIAIQGGGGGGGATTLDGTSSTAANGGMSLYAGSGGAADAQHTAVASAGTAGAAPGGGGGAATGRVGASGATSGDGADGEFSVRIIRGWHPTGITRGY